MKYNSIILFAKGNITNWKGLPKNLLISELIKSIGKPEKIIEDFLGYYPATKYQFSINNNKLIVFVRNQNVILIEANMLPVDNILNELPVPDIQLPQEIIIENAYSSEYIYCKRGLDLTVAKNFNSKIKDKIVRCRGFEILKDPKDFDSKYYKAFEDRKLW